MYMRNKKYDSYKLDGFPANYAGQHSPPPFPQENHGPEPAPRPPEPQHHAPEKKSLLGSLLGGGHEHEHGEKKSGLLSGLLGGGSFLDGIELEDLILIAVIFFLLKDGADTDIILILALILLSG